MSGKRVADSQLSPDNIDDDGDEAPAGGFARASADVLEKRVIKAPKSRLKAAAAGDGAPSPFAGLAAPQPAAFSFGAAAKGPAQPAAFAFAAPSAGFAFGGAPSAPKPAEPAGPTPPAPFKFELGKTAADKPGFGFTPLGSASAPEAKPPAFSFGSGATQAPDAAKPPAFSFGSAGTAGADSAPKPPTFTFGAAPSPATDASSKPPGIAFGASATPASDGASKAPAFGFGTAATPASDSAAPAKPAGGFTFTPPTKAVEGASPAPGGFVFAPAKADPPAPAPASFSFGAKSSGSEYQTSLPAPPSFGSKPLSFGTGAGGSASAASSSSKPSEADMESCLSDLLGLNKAYVKFLQQEMDGDDFGDLGAAAEQYRDFRKGIEAKYPEVIKLMKGERTGAAEKDSGKPAAPAPTVVPPPASSAPAPLFGAASTEAPKFGAPASEAPKAPASLFSFGGAAPAAPSLPAPQPGGAPAFSFGAAAPAFGAAAPAAPAPGGFKFGAPTGAAPAFSFGGLPAAPSAPLFGGMAASHAEDGEGDEDGDDGAMEDEEPQTDRSKLMTGAGEEDEETKFEVKANIFTKKEGWDKIGNGLLKLNVDKATGAARLLARTDNSTVVLNQALHKDINAKALKDKWISFVGILDGKPNLFAVQVKEKSDAEKLLELMEEYKA
ncbi:hypothetical protein DFJ74DRAFT_176349 [Hyaloraphidium curvatum]|nr:hypothetical protein DFJ74DRAFT_176349 [Hyaloraphidium curvatum]